MPKWVSEIEKFAHGRFAPLGLWLLAMASALTGLTESGQRLATRFADDAYYYFTIARNLTRGHGLSFDRLHPTNGFHPLWLALNVGLRLAISDDEGVLRGVLLLQGMLLAAACVLLARGFRGLDRTTGLLCGLLLIGLPGALGSLRCGMESALSACALLTCAVLHERLLERDRAWADLGLAAAWSLAVMARLEAALGLLILGVSLFARVRVGSYASTARRALRVLALPSMTLLLYSGWNVWQFGHALPVNARVKAFWAHDPSTQLSPLEWFLEIPWLSGMWMHHYSRFGRIAESPALATLEGLLLIGVIALAIVTRRWWMARLRETRLHLLTATCALMTLVAYGAEGANYYYYEWQHAPLHLLNAILLGVCLARSRRLRAGALVVLVTLTLARFPRAWSAPLRSFGYYSYGAAEWLRTRTPEDARVASWNAGAIGYYSQRRVINLDGLVNSNAYFERVLASRHPADALSSYLRDERVDYVADYALMHAQLPDPFTALGASNMRACKLTGQASFQHTSWPLRIGIWRVRCSE